MKRKPELKQPCPSCESRSTRVVDTGYSRHHIDRIRKCLDCNFKWNTMEISAERHYELLKSHNAVQALAMLMNERK